MLQIPTIIVDIDGTLALGIGDHRKAYDYHLCGNDKPNPVPWAIVEMWSKYNPFGWIIFMSGRENVKFNSDITLGEGDPYQFKNCYELTRNWLDMYSNLFVLEMKQRLVMREEDDHREDSIVKKEMYEKLKEEIPELDVQFVLDDRNQVVKMWRELGLTCLQVADGDF